MIEGVPAVEYHERTKHDPDSMGGAGLNFANKPRPYKVYEGLDRVSLETSIPDVSVPALQALQGPVAETGGQPVEAGERGAPADVDLETVAGLCYYAGGVTKTVRRRGREFRFRAAACTGALYHVDLYPVCGDLPGLAAGVYHYDPRTDALDVLREGDFRGVLAEASAEPAVEEAPVTFVATSTWWRNAWKYRDRTFRHTFWDSGTVLANLLATANALDLPARVVLGFADDPVTTLLGLDPEWEAPVELVPVGAGSRAPEPPELEPIDPPTEPDDSDPVDYPLVYQGWAAGTLPDGETAREWRGGGDRPVDGRGPGDGERVELDPVGPETASKRPLGNTVLRRGSCRAYRRDPLSFRKTSTVLDRAIRGVGMDVIGPRSETGNPPALQFVDAYCILNGVEGVEPGVYQYHPGGDSNDGDSNGGDSNGDGDNGDGGNAKAELEQLRAGECRREAAHLALDQQLAGDAAVCVYFMADLDAVTDALGDRGYRVAQFEAALAAGRLYLATYAHRDLGGTGLTFYDDEVTEFFEPRAAGQTPMFLYTIGRPA